MSQQQFRELSPDAPELVPILTGLFGEYAARYGDYFSRHKEQEKPNGICHRTAYSSCWSATRRLSRWGRTNLTTRRRQS